MKNLFVIAMLGLFVLDVNADWRMDRFDLNDDGFVVKKELKQAGCEVKVGLFNAADKNDDGKLSKKELRVASEYIVKRRCPRS